MLSDQTPEVTVIVPVYKVENYIRTCLDSLLKQSFSDWEAILVDDGSPDKSGEICDEYAMNDSRFKVIHKKNGGVSSARNTALSSACGNFIFFLDSDDHLHADTLEKLVRLSKTTDSDIVQCEFVRGCDNIFPDFVESTISIYDNHSIFTSYAAKIIMWGKLYRRSVIGDIRFPEGLINEDDFTTWKFYYRAKHIAVTSTPYYYYTVNPCSITANQRRKPDLKYFDAYRERITFFSNTGEVDLEAISRIQWMKSFTMLYSNNQLSTIERKQIKSLFDENYASSSLKSVHIPIKLRLVFSMFRMLPMITSRLVKSR